jgi:hypothetical protein
MLGFFIMFEKQIVIPHCMKLKTVLFYFISLILFPSVGFSQIAITNIAEINNIKNGTTFFAMKDPASTKAKEYIEVIKKYWSISKVECIKYIDVEKNIAPNNSFVTIGAAMTTSNSITTSTETHIYLEFWTTNGKYTYDPKKRRHFNQEDKILVATVELFPDFTAQNNPSSLYKMDYDAAGHLKNWSAGILGNYIQQLTTLLKKGEVRGAKTEFYNKEEVYKVSSQTLFIPDYVLTKFSKNSDDESKKYEEKEITDGCNLSCKIITAAELNIKITAVTFPFYYLLFIKTNSDKYTTVTNAQTGEIIYSAYSSSASNFKPSDLKEIQNIIKKK